MTDTRSTPPQPLHYDEAVHFEKWWNEQAATLEMGDHLKFAAWNGWLERATRSESAPILPPTHDEIAAYRDLFRTELDKNMNNHSGSPSTDAHTVALHAFVAARNKEGK